MRVGGHMIATLGIDALGQENVIELDLFVCLPDNWDSSNQVEKEAN
jgi:hypothetical protein